MSSFYHIHIPQLLEIALYNASLIVVAHGPSVVPYQVLYDKAVMTFAETRLHRQTPLNWYYDIVTGSELDMTEICSKASHVHTALMLDHAVVENVTSMIHVAFLFKLFAHLCTFTFCYQDDLEIVVQTIIRLVSRVGGTKVPWVQGTQIPLRKSLMSVALLQHSGRGIRQLLEMYGGELDKSNSNYIFTAARCGYMSDVAERIDAFMTSTPVEQHPHVIGRIVLNSVTAQCPEMLDYALTLLDKFHVDDEVKHVIFTDVIAFGDDASRAIIASKHADLLDGFSDDDWAEVWNVPSAAFLIRHNVPLPTRLRWSHRNGGAWTVHMLEYLLKQGFVVPRDALLDMMGIYSIPVCFELMKLLIRNGADIDAVKTFADEDGDVTYPLILLHLEFARLFVDCGVNPHSKNTNDENVFHVMARSDVTGPTERALFDMFRSLGVGMNQANLKGETPLEIAFRHGSSCAGMLSSSESIDKGRWMYNDECE